MGNSEKASRYIALLDIARTNASWSEVPELVRKVNKHAPQRRILTQASTAEHFVATTGPKSTPISDDVPAPLKALFHDSQPTSADEEEDRLQGKACLLWAYSNQLVKQPEIARPTEGLTSSMRSLSKSNTSTWTKICIVRTAYIEGIRLKQVGRALDAKSLFSLAVDIIQANRDLILATPQLAYWSEQLLAQLALSSPDDNSVSPEATNLLRLQVFRHWAVLASTKSESPSSAYRNSTGHVTRLQIWRTYFAHISMLLKMSSVEDSNEHHSLVADLRKVEKLYENELLKAHKFPKATGSNAAIEAWVEQVIQNWQTLCGPQWQDVELGEGGRNAFGRSVLDVLYRAATKTFHSTLILRRLFQVHKSLAEFDLAYRSLDTYIELTERAHERAIKSTTSSAGTESHETFLLTLSEGIDGLCSFGGKEEARKAHELCSRIDDWLYKIGIRDSSAIFVNGEVPDTDAEPPGVNIPSRSLEVIYRAMGVAQAHWARWTPFTERRTQLQEDAVENLQKACSLQSSGETMVETLYVTALVLAETRDIEDAVGCIKMALSQVASAPSDSPKWALERKSVSLWHLLALLLSSRHDFETAMKSCSAAVEQFPPSAILLGGNNLAVVGEKSQRPSLVSDMESSELQRLIEIRITELALIELRDGHEEAVNCSNDLLNMIAQLFTHLELESFSAASKSAPPKTPAGTHKSVRSSIFARRRHRPAIEQISPTVNDTNSSTTNNTRPSSQTTHAPTIQVTDEHGKSPKHKHGSLRASLEIKGDRRAGPDAGQRKLVRKASQRSTQKQDDGSIIPEVSVSLHHNKSGEAKQDLPEIRHNLAPHQDMPPPASHGEQPPQQDIRLPTVHALTNSTSPLPRFPKVAAQKHALTILVKVWLVIAKLYRRANMFDDSREACEEAEKAADQVESIVSSIEYSARAFAKAGWGGGGKSVDEVWADVFHERAELQLAIFQHRTADVDEGNITDLLNAVKNYEHCLMLSPDHPGGVVGLSNVLLDYYEKKVDLVKVLDEGRLRNFEQNRNLSSASARSSLDVIPGSFEIPTANGVETRATPATASRPFFRHRTSTTSIDSTGRPSINPKSPEDEALRKTPDNLNRLAARDRAYGLLSTLTKLGHGWDNSEAWYALARAHELGGEIEKAKSILWWCIELEDKKPIRHWRNLSYSLE